MQQANRFRIQPGGKLSGQLTVPGDKSISHRAIMLGAIAEGETNVSGFLQGEDTLATMQAFQQMGVSIERSGSNIRIIGVGLGGLKAPGKPLDLGNSGTSVRLLAGLLAGQRFDVDLTGDESLRKRPMRRVIDPLMQMNASISCTDDGTLPVHITGGQQLHGIEYDMPVASAQLKSCLLLAGLYASGTTIVIECKPTRDHTERMLTAFGCPVDKQGQRISIQSSNKLVGNDVHVPADFSSAAFFIVAAAIVPGSDIVIKNVGVNPTRHAMLDILKLMGAKIDLLNQREQTGEPVADIHVEYSQLNGITIPEALVPIAIDEFPIIFIAAAAAKGVTKLSGAAELRVKESDRIESMLAGLLALGIKAEALGDGMIIEGGKFSGGEVNSFTDHRIAMAFSVAGMLATDTVTVNDCTNVATSFPGFFDTARQIGMHIDHG